MSQLEVGEARLLLLAPWEAQGAAGARQLELDGVGWSGRWFFCCRLPRAWQLGGECVAPGFMF